MRTNKVLTALSLSLVMFSAACGSDEDGGKNGYDISESALTGTVNGEPFEFKSGYAEDKFGDGEYWVELYTSEVEDPCAFGASPEGAKIILSVTGEPMDAALSLQNNITFSYGESSNDVATQGRLVIDGMQGDMLTGGLFATTGDHEVDGTFEVKVCSDAQ